MIGGHAGGYFGPVGYSIDGCVTGGQSYCDAFRGQGFNKIIVVEFVLLFNCSAVCIMDSLSYCHNSMLQK